MKKLILIESFLIVVTVFSSYSVLQSDGLSRDTTDNIIVQWGEVSVMIDGIYSENEWKDSNSIINTIDGNDWTILHKHDEEFLYISSSYHEEFKLNITLDIEYNKNSEPVWDDRNLGMDNDTRTESFGTGKEWKSYTPNGWDAEFVNETFLEIRISFEKLNIVSGDEKKFGISFNMTTRFTQYSWPMDSEINNPSTWGVIESADNWKRNLLDQNVSHISTGNVIPNWGFSDTLFNFSIYFFDSRNNPPIGHEIVIDGTPFIMKTNDFSYNNGSFYNYQTKLNPGKHEYFFRFRNETIEMTYPDNNQTLFLMVYEYNSPPTLKGEGIPSNIFNFKEDSNMGSNLIDLELYFYDDFDDGNLTFQIIYQEDQKNLSASLNGSFLSFSQNMKNWNGICEFQVKAIDNGVDGPSGKMNIMETMSNKFTVEVIPTNDPPSILFINGIDVLEKKSLEFGETNSAIYEELFNLTFIVFDADTGDFGEDTLELSVNSTIGHIHTLSNEEFIFSLEARNDIDDKIFLNFTLKDSTGNSDHIEIVININIYIPLINHYSYESRYYPISENKIKFTDEHSIFENEWLNISLKLKYRNYTMFTINPLHNHMIVDYINGSISYLARQRDIGIQTFDIKISNTINRTIIQEVLLVIQIKNINDPPIIIDIFSSNGNFIFKEGESEFIKVNYTDKDLEIEGLDTHSFLWSHNNININNKDILNISSLSPGVYIIKIKVEDSYGLYDEFLKKIEILPDNPDENRYSLIYILTIITLSITIFSLMVFLTLITSLRVTEKNVLDNCRRKIIYNFIRENPGTHYYRMMNSLEIPSGVLSHHINILEKFNHIKSNQDGGYRRFYLYDKKIEYKLTLSNLQHNIMFLVKKQPGINQTDISKEIGKHKMVINYHIKILKDIGLLNIEKNGRETNCFISNNGNQLLFS